MCSRAKGLRAGHHAGGVRARSCGRRRPALSTSSYSPRHFREHIEDGTLRFDYRIHDGPSSSRNAIALLEVLGAPRAVVEEARARAEG